MATMGDKAPGVTARRRLLGAGPVRRARLGRATGSPALGLLVGADTAGISMGTTTVGIEWAGTRGGRVPSSRDSTIDGAHADQATVGPVQAGVRVTTSPTTCESTRAAATRAPTLLKSSGEIADPARRAIAAAALMEVGGRSRTGRMSWGGCGEGC
jgi:hypothetical protein